MTALSKLTPYRKNPRVIPDTAVAAVAASLKRFGWQQAIVADPKGVIVAGETRYKAAVSLGLTAAPVVTIPARQARAFRVIDNRTSEMTSWDTDLLPDALAGLNDLDIFSFDDVLPLKKTAGHTDEDAIPDAPKLRTKLGDVWQLGNHRLMCGQSETDFEGFASDVEHGLVLTDPPYGISIVKGLGTIGGAKPFGRKGEDIRTGTVGAKNLAHPRRYRQIANDDKPFDPTWIMNLGKAQVVFGAQFFASKLRDGTAWICWDKGTSSESTFSGFELAWTSLVGRARMYRHTWSGMVREGDRKTELADRVHPTQKPVGLLKQMLDDIGTGFDVVLDPYLGSGSTLIACEILKRRCYAMEIDPCYVDVTVKRWEDFTGKKAKRK